MVHLLSGSQIPGCDLVLSPRWIWVISVRLLCLDQGGGHHWRSALRVPQCAVPSHVTPGAHMLPSQSKSVGFVIWPRGLLRPCWVRKGAAGGYRAEPSRQADLVPPKVCSTTEIRLVCDRRSSGHMSSWTPCASAGRWVPCPLRADVVLKAEAVRTGPVV